MQSDPHERALAVFDAFLRYVRDPRAGQGSQPRPAPTSPGRASQYSVEDGGFGNLPSRFSTLSDASASKFAPMTAGEPAWDEPTQPRSGAADEPRRYSPRPPPPVAPESSIIIDEELTKPMGLPEPDPTLQEDADETRVFMDEMRVLIKYGHAEQVPREIDRWLRVHGDDLEAHYRLADFEITRVDANGGLERLFGLASRALDRGEMALAYRVLERVAREAPTDLRVLALRDRLGRG